MARIVCWMTVSLRTQKAHYFAALLNQVRIGIDALGQEKRREWDKGGLFLTVMKYRSLATSSIR